MNLDKQHLQRPRAALYARVSTTGKGQDPQMQLDALTALAQQRGWQVADVYVDNGVSGKKDSRPEFDRMMADAHAGRINVVCCWKFDRVGRSVQHLVRCLETFRALGIDFISVTESIDTSTPVGKLVYSVIASIAEFEHSLILERIACGVARARRQGKKFGRPRHEVDMARVERLLAHGHSLRSVAKLLDVSRGTLRYRLKLAGQKSASSSVAATPGNL